jgi:hypothetical protein
MSIFGITNPNTKNVMDDTNAILTNTLFMLFII